MHFYIHLEEQVLKVLKAVFLLFTYYTCASGDFRVGGDFPSVLRIHVPFHVKTPIVVEWLSFYFYSDLSRKLLSIFFKGIKIRRKLSGWYLNDGKRKPAITTLRSKVESENMFYLVVIKLPFINKMKNIKKYRIYGKIDRIISGCFENCIFFQIIFFMNSKTFEKRLLRNSSHAQSSSSRTRSKYCVCVQLYRFETPFATTKIEILPDPAVREIFAGNEIIPKRYSRRMKNFDISYTPGHILRTKMGFFCGIAGFGVDRKPPAYITRGKLRNRISHHRIAYYILCVSRMWSRMSLFNSGLSPRSSRVVSHNKSLRDRCKPAHVAQNRFGKITGIRDKSEILSVYAW